MAEESWIGGQGFVTAPLVLAGINAAETLFVLLVENIVEGKAEQREPPVYPSVNTA